MKTTMTMFSLPPILLPILLLLYVPYSTSFCTQHTNKIQTFGGCQVTHHFSNHGRIIQIATANNFNFLRKNHSLSLLIISLSSSKQTNQEETSFVDNTDSESNVKASAFEITVESKPKKISSWFIEGPSIDTKPDYENIHGPLGPIFDKIFLTVFRQKMAEKVGVDSSLPNDNYQGLIELTAALNARYSNRTQVQAIAQDVLRSLFPSWLPKSFSYMFAKPFPVFSARLNAWATYVSGTWLMGECELNDCEIDGGGIGHQQGLLVKRCRFLEEAGCASVCVNSCKIPTQNFFNNDMGLPLTMTPNYETGECQFSFGLTPTDASEMDAKNTPCLNRCPSNGGMRKWHSGKTDVLTINGGVVSETQMCHLMDK